VYALSFSKNGRANNKQALLMEEFDFNYPSKAAQDNIIKTTTECAVNGHNFVQGMNVVVDGKNEWYLRCLHCGLLKIVRNEK